MAIHIGCSGWHYLHWRGNFYPTYAKPNEYLNLYLKHFDTVEINNSFYRLPTEHSLLSWKQGVPANFTFSVKASRFITHNKKLKDSDDAFQLFFNRILLLGDKLGPVLFQLPPTWNYNGVRLEEFLTALPRPNDYVFEFRNRDWLRDEMFALLRQYNVGFCIHDMPGSITPDVVTSKIAYVRFHGNGEKYSGGYPNRMLEQWAENVVEWQKNHITPYVYLNNDIGGFAPRNALTLKNIIEEKYN
ncbi:MAG: DUF72 domain-containing protein [Gammaproteobacteria bacterium]|nr:MAG: DUF72 domain-containing protein [Gammaproteobacteria bacterium]